MMKKNDFNFDEIDFESLRKIYKQDHNNNLVYEPLKTDGLIRCRYQLSENERIKLSFDLMESIIDVVQGGYAISNGQDKLFTYGIEPCCGVVLSNGEKSILFHLDGTTTPEEVKKITDENGFDSTSQVLICPGTTCGVPGSFKYQELENLYKNAGYNVIINRIVSTFGYVEVDGNKARVGSALIPESEKIVELSQNGYRR